jgi:hypothetical protein
VRSALASKHWDFGIARDGVEITMPLSLNLCVVLSRQRLYRPNERQPLSKSEARILNCRQRAAATKYVYGNSPAALDFIKNPLIL